MLLNMRENEIIRKDNQVQIDVIQRAYKELDEDYKKCMEKLNNQQKQLEQKQSAFDRIKQDME